MQGESSLKVLWTYPRLLIVAAFLFVVRFYLSVRFPVVADEAYYFYWGTHPAGGYYDLPPMVGWWESLLSWFSLQSWWLRIPNLAVQFLISFGIREWTRLHLGELSSALLAMLYFFLPVPFFAVIMAPDLPLLFFTFYASVLLFGANKRREFLLVGALWGAAFLSKYFAVFTLLAWGIWYFFERLPARRPQWKQDLGMFVLGAAPFLLQHLIWNSQHCWSNFVFNLITRQKASDGTWISVMGWFLLYLVLLSTPFLWLKRPSRLEGLADSSPGQALKKFALLSWLVPMSCFALTAVLGKGQGIHWYLPYLPYFIIWLGLGWVHPRVIRARLWGVLLITLVLGGWAVSIVSMPDRALKPWLKDRHAFEYELAIRPELILEDLHPSLNGMDAVFMDGYSLASVMDLEMRKRYQSQALPVSTMGPGSRFGRVFDFSLPMNTLDGKNVLFIARSEWSHHDWARFFETTESRWHEVSGVKYWVSKGIGFRFPMYEAEVLARVKKDYYPSFLGLPSRCDITVRH